MRTKVLEKLNKIKIKILNNKKKRINRFYNYKMIFKMVKYKDYNNKITMMNNVANSKSKSYL